MFRLSGAVSRGEAVYRSMRDAMGGAFADGGHADASMFARAMCLGRALAWCDRAQDQALPSRALELLPSIEREYGIVPSRGATIAQRRVVLGERVRPPRGASRPEVEVALRKLLGADFVSYITNTPNVTAPADPAAGPGLFKSAFAPRKLARLTADVVPLPGPALRPLHVTPLEVGGAEIVAGDIVVLTPDNGSMAEKCRVVADGGGLVVAAVRGHEAGDVVTTQPWPYWIGTRRHDLIMVTDAAARDPQKRRAVDALLADVMRAPTQWSVASATGFRLDLDPMDITVLG